MISTFSDAIDHALDILNNEYAFDLEYDDVVQSAYRIRDLLKRRVPIKYWSILTTSPGQSEYDAPSTDIDGEEVEGWAIDVFYAPEQLAGAISASAGNAWEYAFEAMLNNLQMDVLNRALPYNVALFNGKIILSPAPASEDDILVLMAREKEDEELTQDDLTAIANKVVARKLRGKASEERRAGGFRAGLYARTGVADAVSGWNDDAKKYEDAFDGYINSGIYGQVESR